MSARSAKIIYKQAVKLVCYRLADMLIGIFRTAGYKLVKPGPARYFYDGGIAFAEITANLYRAQQ
ncbi:hypothetical protein [Methylomonas rosea]|uniref:Uncharacterized protein n=1 Tax=Methylomonas rosea TaxID=2952227 RepID=A0ABT1TP97_9GAMM|nr:hypothetical protein [Methylomonas sp. WSC-7]MCQ8116605.1 hypothetical protein [Methylomonas sp. WSC-7]